MRISNVKIGARLSVAFGVLLLLLIGVAYCGWSSLVAAKSQIDRVVLQDNVRSALANEMRGDLNVTARSVRNYMLFKEPDIRAQQAARIKEADRSYDEAYEKFGTLLTLEKGKQVYARMGQERAETRQFLQHLHGLVDGDKSEEAGAYLRDTVQVSQEKWLASIQDLIDLQEKESSDAVRKMNADYNATVTLLSFITLAAVAFGVVIAWLITRSITRPIDEAVRVAQTVAAGDLTSNIVVTNKDETGQLLQALKDMNGSLRSIVDQVRGGTDTISTASSQIATGNLDLSSRTEQQASSLEETASSMEELTSTVKQNGDNARAANQLAISASEIAVRGGQVVSQVVDTMGAINESAKKIVDIISVIDGIAFQTNILALNAAVEAARAGEQGRGFAVVASEVRNLAQRSAAAAKEIKFLIGDSVEKVDTGSKLVSAAGETMDEIVNSVKRVTDIMGEITAAGREQEVGIEQINQAISEMDTVTQQNAALVEEAAAASASLQDQAASLAQVVSVFKINGVSKPNALSAKPTSNVAPVIRLNRKSVAPRGARNHQVAARHLANAPIVTNEEWEQF